MSHVVGQPAPGPADAHASPSSQACPLSHQASGPQTHASGQCSHANQRSHTANDPTLYPFALWFHGNENVTSSIKPEVHNVSQRRQKRPMSHSHRQHARKAGEVWLHGSRFM